jgi:hypothetical protein
MQPTAPISGLRRGQAVTLRRFRAMLQRSAVCRNAAPLIATQPNVLH